MGWIRQVTRALMAGKAAQVHSQGAWVYPYVDSGDELTIAPVDPAEVRRRDLVFIRWKNSYVLRLVLDTRNGEVLVASQRRDEGDWIAADSVLGKVIRIDKQYAHRDPSNPEICYDYLSAGSPPAEAWGDYGQVTFAFRARYDHWDFVLSRDPEFAAEDVADLTWYDLEATQQSGHPFPEEQVAAFQRCFVRSGQYGKEGSFAASYMSQEEVLRIIRECVSEYERETAS